MSVFLAVLFALVTGVAFAVGVYLLQVVRQLQEENEFQRGELGRLDSDNNRLRREGARRIDRLVEKERALSIAQGERDELKDILAKVETIAYELDSVLFDDEQPEPKRCDESPFVLAEELEELADQLRTETDEEAA